jgi:signal transduction histidine kinase
LQETRRALKALRASPLDDLGLVKAIQTMTDTAAQRGRFVVELSLPEHDLILSPDVEQCLYRVAQETVENIVRHANARHVRVSVSVKEREIELLIQDDGVGFHPDQGHQPGHFGLDGMRERARLAGGNLTIISIPGSGTTIRLGIKGYPQ